MPGGVPRGPLSARYDTRARRALAAAVAAHGRGAAVPVWVTSPGAEFTSTDRGGRTRHERAFTRSIYYQLAHDPAYASQPPRWSLKLEWGHIENRRGHYGRTCQVRIFARPAGAAYITRHPARSWAARPELRSTTDRRIDT